MGGWGTKGGGVRGGGGGAEADSRTCPSSALGSRAGSATDRAQGPGEGAPMNTNQNAPHDALIVLRCGFGGHLFPAICQQTLQTDFEGLVVLRQVDTRAGGHGGLPLSPTSVPPTPPPPGELLSRHESPEI